MDNILIKPSITEKSLKLAGQGWYTFLVSPTCRKNMIIRQINDLFKVHVVDIRTAKYKAVVRRTGKKRLLTLGKVWKKAAVRLKDKEKIDLFTVEQQPSKKV